MTSRAILPKKPQDSQSSIKTSKSKVKIRVVNLLLNNKMNNNFNTIENSIHRKKSKCDDSIINKINKNKPKISIHKKELSTDKIFNKSVRKISYTKSGKLSESVTNYKATFSCKNNKLAKVSCLSYEIPESLDSNNRINNSNTIITSINNPFRDEREYLKIPDKKININNNSNPLKRINQSKSPRSKEMEKYKNKKLKEKKNKSNYLGKNRFLIKKIQNQKVIDNIDKFSCYTNKNDISNSTIEKETIDNKSNIQRNKIDNKKYYCIYNYAKNDIINYRDYCKSQNINPQENSKNFIINSDKIIYQNEDKKIRTKNIFKDKKSSFNLIKNDTKVNGNCNKIDSLITSSSDNKFPYSIKEIQNKGRNNINYEVFKEQKNKKKVKDKSFDKKNFVVNTNLKYKKLNVTQTKSEKKIYFEYKNPIKLENNNKKEKIKNIIEKLNAKYKKFFFKRCINKWKIFVLYEKIFDFDTKKENSEKIFLLLNRIFINKFKIIAYNNIKMFIREKNIIGLILKIINITNNNLKRYFINKCKIIIKTSNKKKAANILNHLIIKEYLNRLKKYSKKLNNLVFGIQKIKYFIIRQILIKKLKYNFSSSKIFESISKIEKFIKRKKLIILQNVLNNIKTSKKIKKQSEIITNENASKIDIISNKHKKNKNKQFIGVTTCLNTAFELKGAPRKYKASKIVNFMNSIPNNTKTTTIRNIGNNNTEKQNINIQNNIITNNLQILLVPKIDNKKNINHYFEDNLQDDFIWTENAGKWKVNQDDSLYQITDRIEEILISEIDEIENSSQKLSPNMDGSFNWTQQDEKWIVENNLTNNSFYENIQNNSNIKDSDEKI